MYLATSLTHMRFVTCVYTCVHGQGRALDELFAALRPFTDMRPFATVNPLCRTSIRPDFKMNEVELTMTSQITSPGKAFTAMAAGK